MKGIVELLSTRMRAIDFEAMFVSYVQSILQSRKYCLIDKKPFLEF